MTLKKGVMEDNQAGVTSEGFDESSADFTPTAESEAREGQESSTSQSENTGEEKGQLTDRGTKVAKEPESQFYQSLKNENADMRALLSDPQALKEYLRVFEGTQAPQKGEADDLADIAEKVSDANGQIDPAKLVPYLEQRLMGRIETGVKYLTDNSIRSHQIEQGYNSDKAAIRAEHPELDPSNKDKFDPELEQFVGERFIAQGGLEGKVTLKQVVDSTFGYLSKVKGAGQAAAETEIVRKRAGAIATSTVQGEVRDGEEAKSPAEILATRVRTQVAKR